MTCTTHKHYYTGSLYPGKLCDCGKFQWAQIAPVKPFALINNPKVGATYPSKTTLSALPGGKIRN